MLRFVLVVFLMVFVATAHVSAHGAKDPMVALTLGILIPGGGQIYNGQPAKALIPIGGLAIGALVFDRADNEAAGVVIFAGTWIWSIFDGPMSADKINQRNRFGHLLEFDKEQIVLGVDPIVSRHSLGTTVSVRF